MLTVTGLERNSLIRQVNGKNQTPTFNNIDGFFLGQANAFM